MSADYGHELKALVEQVVEQRASDLHLMFGHKPVLRVNGELIPFTDKPVLNEEDVRGFAAHMLSDFRKQMFENHLETDFAYTTESGVRFRGHIYLQQRKPGIVLRFIPNEIKSVEELNLPPILYSFGQKRQGFFLCVGPVGQGKSTTLAAIVNYINQTRTEHVVTIENPIEYVYTSDKSMIDQREVGVDTESFEAGLTAAFRQDVNVLLIGEMRNRETIGAAVTAAETGHLVMSTLHTNNAAQTISRIIDSFPGDMQDQIRLQLAGSLVGIFSQRLLPKIEGGLVPAFELLVNNSAVANLIREDRIHEIPTIIETGLEHGMLDMNRSLIDLVKKGIITTETAFTYSYNPKALERLM